MTPYQQYLEADREINEGLIRLERSLARGDTPPDDPDARMAAMRGFLAALGDPQRGLPAVHVAGTSGKGSVAKATAAILRAAGLRIGLHVSPYLQSATEKIDVDGRFASASDFADLVRWVLPAARPLVHDEAPASIHGMASVAVAFEAFRRARCDAVVIEASCGGRYDLTSFVDTRVAVITNIGLDHVGSLGPTIERIAWHKAGIARAGAPLITGAVRGSPAAIIAGEARAVGARLVPVPSAGDPLAHNRILAESAARELAAALGIGLDDGAVAAGLAAPLLAARCERMPGRPGEPTVFLDGAHNPGKLAVAAAAFAAAAPAGRRVALVGVLGAKASPDLLLSLAGRFDAAVATEPEAYGKPALPAARTAALLARHGLETEIEARPEAALELALELAGPQGSVLATGSFYLVGALRERWFPKQRVVLERTSWPAS
jgi:dihydrofolate synthase/folylpolyglutamate synthase